LCRYNTAFEVEVIMSKNIVGSRYFLFFHVRKGAKKG
jgi:hypothetical protein